MVQNIRSNGEHPERSEQEGVAPKARKDDLLVSEVADELLVYDLKRHRGHSLNGPAALVWRECDGRKSIAELTAVLKGQLPMPP